MSPKSVGVATTFFGFLWPVKEEQSNHDMGILCVVGYMILRYMVLGEHRT